MHYVFRTTFTLAKSLFHSQWCFIKTRRRRSLLPGVTSYCAGCTLKSTQLAYLTGLFAMCIYDMYVCCQYVIQLLCSICLEKIFTKIIYINIIKKYLAHYEICRYTSTLTYTYVYMYKIIISHAHFNANQLLLPI